MFTAAKSSRESSSPRCSSITSRTSTSKAGGTANVNCVSCNYNELLAGTGFCPECGTPQPKPAPITAPVPIPNCVKCNAVLLAANAKFCAECGKRQPHAVNPPPDINTNPLLYAKKSCLLCQELVPAMAQSCSICSAPQDEESFIKLPTKNCVNLECGALLLQSHQACFHCKRLQQDQNIDEPSHSIPPIFTKEEMKAKFRQDKLQHHLHPPAQMTQKQMNQQGYLLVHQYLPGQQYQICQYPPYQMGHQQYPLGYLSQQMNQQGYPPGQQEQMNQQGYPQVQQEQMSQQGYPQVQQEQMSQQGYPPGELDQTEKVHVSQMSSQMESTPSWLSVESSERLNSSVAQEMPCEASSSHANRINCQPKLGFTSDVLNPKDDKAMTIEFNAVLPLKAWEWKDGKSYVYMRFGHRQLGKWEYDFGPCKLVRDAGNGLYVVRYILKLDYEFVKSLTHGMLYKYLVYSPRLKEKENHPWEYFYGDPFYESAGKNRILKIPYGKVAKGIRHRQFDTMIFPDTKFVNFFTQDDSSKFVIPSPPAMRAHCMEIHLKPSRDLLLNGSYKCEICTGTDGIFGLLKSVSIQYIEYRESQRSWTIDISTAFMDWSMNVAGELLTSDAPLEPHKTLVSLLLLMCSLYKSLELPQFKNIPKELMITLLKLMVLSTVTAKNDLDYVKSLINNPNSKKYVVNGLKYLIRSVIDIKNPEHVIDILKALPLYHFLTDDSLEPYQPLCYDPKKAKWEDDLLNLHVTKSLMERQDHQFIGQHRNTLQRLVSFDQKLLYIIPYICPQKDTCHLCDIVPLDIAIAWIPESLSLNSSSTRLSSYSHDKMKDLFIQPMACIQQNIVEGDNIDFQVIKYCSDACVYLIECLQRKLYNNVTRNIMTFVTSTVKLMLCITDKAKRFKGETDGLIREGMGKVKKMLKEWIVHKEVIGGSFFGGSVKFNRSVPVELKKEKDELMIWESLLNIATESVDLITEDMQRDLENIILSLVDERVSAIPSAELKIDVFINVESREKYPDAFRNIFLIKAIEALDELVSKKDNYNIQRWEEIIKLQSHHTIRLVSKILEKKYPKFMETHEIPFNDFFEWGLWPGFITIYTTQSEIKSKPEAWQLIVACAVSMLEGVCRRIHSGDVTVDELKHIKSHQIQMNKLCNAINTTTQSGPQASLTQTSELHKSMELRLEEFKYFTEYVNKLKHLIAQVGTTLQGHDELLRQLHINPHEVKINNLCCTLMSGVHKVICFPFAEPLECCLHDFYTMSHVHSSDTFHMFWQAQIDKVSKSKSCIALEELDGLLWKPVFNKSTRLLNSLDCKKIKLSEIDFLFKQRYAKNPKDSLIKDLQALHAGVNGCKNIFPIDNVWISNVCNLIHQYWNFCSYREVACALIRVRDDLQLTGDFSFIERIINQVLVPDQTLHSVDLIVSEPNSLLQIFATDIKKRDCLEAFADSQTIVEWIRTETPDETSLSEFVTKTITTAAGGEGDMATDKLSWLRTVGNGFGPLIYKLKKTAGYIELHEHCKTLWETLEDNPELPAMIRICDHDVEWYQFMKELMDTLVEQVPG